jgi:hypothetical protein
MAAIDGPMDGDSGADQDTSDLGNALDQLAKSYGGYVKAEQYYDDERGEYFASIRVRRAIARTGAGFRFGFAKTPVDAVAERLEISSITCTDERANAQLQDMWDDNQLDLEMPNVFRRACEYGDSYVIVWPSTLEDTDGDGDEGGEDTDGDEPAEGDNSPALLDTDADGLTNVDIFYNSPTCCRLFYDPEKPLRKSFAVKKWTLHSTKQVRVDLYYRNRIERYISPKGKLQPKPTDMLPFVDEQSDTDGVIANPFNEIPVFHFRTDRPYGVPEHKPFYGAQDAIHKLIISHMSGVDYTAFPQRYALMDADADTGEATNNDEDTFSFALDTGATSRPSDPQSQLTSDPGSFWQLRGMRSVGQFAEADPKVFLEPMMAYLKFGATLSNTPMRLFDFATQLPSGASQIQLEGPFIKKVCNRQLSFGATLRELFVFALKITGFADARVTVNWKSPVVVNDLVGWQTIQAKIAAGMPPEQAFLEAGYTPEQVYAWFEGHDLRTRVALLAQIAQALNELGPALGAGVIDDQQKNDLITATLGEYEDEGQEPEPAPVGGGT